MSSDWKVYNSGGYTEDKIDLSLMSRAFKKNSDNILGKTYKVDRESFETRLCDTPILVVSESLFTINSDYILPFPCNVFILLELEQTNVTSETPELTASMIMSELSKGTADDDPGGIDHQLCLKIFPTIALRKLLSKDSQRVIAEAWSPSIKTVDTRLIGQIFTYYTSVSACVVQIENNLVDMEFGTNTPSQITRLSSDIVTNKVHITNLKRVLLLDSTSAVSNIRSVCASIITHYRTVSRIKWLQDVSEGFQDITGILQSQRSSASAATISRILFALTSFTVLSGLFFGLFQLSDTAPIASRGFMALADPSLIAPLLISTISFILLTIVVVLWPRR